MVRSQFKLNLAGLNELMKSKKMQSYLKQAGQAVAAAAGEDYGTETYVLNFVAVQNVFPESAKAARDNYETNALIKALGSAGLSMTK